MNPTPASAITPPSIVADILEFFKWLFSLPIWGLLFAVAIIVIGYLITHPEKAQLWQGIIQSWSKSKESNKKSVTNRVSANYKSAKRYMPQIERDIFPSDIVIKWKDAENENRESFVAGNQIIVRIDRTDNINKAASIAAMEVAKVGVLPICKKYLGKDLCQASDYMIARKLLKNMQGGFALSYFDAHIFMPLYEKSSVFKELFDKLQQTDSQGMYIAVFLNELQKVADLLLQMPVNSEIQLEMNAFLSFLYDVCTQNPAPKLRFVEKHIRINIAYTGTNYRLAKKNPYDFYVSKAFSAFEQGIQTVYLFATGKKIEDAKQVEVKFNELHPDFAITKQIGFVRINDDNFTKKDAVCIEFQRIMS